MEFNCSSCGTRLRIPDTHRNPRVRCPRCGLVARPLAPSASPSRPVAGFPAAAPAGGLTGRPPESPRPLAQRPTSPRPTPPRPTPPRPAPVDASGRGFSGGIGIGLIVLTLVLSRAPQLLKNLLPGGRQRPPAVEQREKERERERVLRELEEGIRATEKKLGRPGQPAGDEDNARRD